MTGTVSDFSSHVSAKLRVLGFSNPSASAVRRLLETAYLASMRTEEARYLRGSLTYADPSTPELHPPLTRRADYPSFSHLGKRIPFTAEAVSKLSRAIDRWSGSMAVYGKTADKTYIWGILDQLVGSNILLHREAMEGFAPPGILSVTVDSVGDISAYHERLFLGRLRQNELILKENDALRSSLIFDELAPSLRPVARSIANFLGEPRRAASAAADLFQQWINTISRICIGLRRLNTGGALLITPRPKTAVLEIHQRFSYPRLGDAAILSVLDRLYLLGLEERLLEPQYTDAIPRDFAWELDFAEADAADRDTEVTGVVKLVTSLATMDGIVVMDPLLHVIGFGAKIKTAGNLQRVYDGAHFERLKTKARAVDTSRFGTRHGSMLRYCQADRRAIGVVISQDGQVRVIKSVGPHLLFWDNAKLLAHENDVVGYARESQRRSHRRRKTNETAKLGYTSIPKTLTHLLSHK